MSSFISFLSLCAVFLIDFLKVWPERTNDRIISNRLSFVISATTVIVIIVLWISYVINYNKSGNSTVFLVGILPIWDLNYSEIAKNLENIRHIWLDHYFYRPLHYYFLIGFLISVLYFKHIRKDILFLTLFISMGFIGFIVLFFNPLGQHDYYVIDLLILAIFIMLSLFSLLRNRELTISLLNIPIFRVLAILLVVLSVSHTSKHIKKRFTGWHNSRHLTEFYGYASIEPYLDSIGITRSDKVLSYNDPTINVTLYLMNRHGWTKYGTNMNDSLSIVQRINMGAEYLLYHHEIDTLKGSFWKHMVEYDVGKYKNVTISKISLPDE